MKHYNTNPVQEALDNSLDEDEYHVEKILNHIKRGKTTQYLIKWKDYPDSDNTWEKESNLNCQEKLDEYLDSIASRGRAATQEGGDVVNPSPDTDKVTKSTTPLDIELTPKNVPRTGLKTFSTNRYRGSRRNTTSTTSRYLDQ